VKQTVSQVFKRWVRIAAVVVLVWTSLGRPGNLPAKSRRVKNRPVIRVRIYNYAQVRKMDLRDAERHAAYFFARAGVRIAWTVQPRKQRAGRPQPEDSVADFFVRIVPAFMAAGYRRDPEALGQSLVPSGVQGPTAGGFANIFWGRVKDRSSKSGSRCSEVLGDALAHELGHLLLGSGHSSRGIMRAHWALRDLMPDRRAQLRFLPAQVTLLQRAARQLQHDRLPAVFAQR